MAFISLRTCVLAVLIAYVTLNAPALLTRLWTALNGTTLNAAACGDQFNVDTLQRGSELLRTQVRSCATSTTYSMEGLSLDLLMRNIPVRFDLENANPNRIVEIEMTVEEVTRSTAEVQRSWHVSIDADSNTPTQNAHFGYTVYGIKPRVAKASGHIFFRQDLVPPNVRPPLNSGGQTTTTAFTDQLTSANGQFLYRLDGTRYRLV